MSKGILAHKVLRYLNVKKNNPVVRLPAQLFKKIDKRKQNIPMVLAFDKDLVVVFVDRPKLNSEGKGEK